MIAAQEEADALKERERQKADLERKERVLSKSRGRSQGKLSQKDQFEDSLDVTKTPGPKGEIKPDVPHLKNLARPQTANPDRVSRQQEMMNSNLSRTQGAREPSREQKMLAKRQAREAELRRIEEEEKAEELQQELQDKKTNETQKKLVNANLGERSLSPDKRSLPEEVEMNESPDRGNIASVNSFGEN